MRVAITRHSILVVSILAVMQSSVVLAEDGASPNAEGSTGTEEENMTTPPKEPKVVDSDFNVKDHLDWGTYYDPQNIFCGKYDCYKILGLDYEEYDAKKKPDKQIITKRYRALSREWHPDKSKHKNAKERFVVSNELAEQDFCMCACV
jgi:DnaJ family protein C protein 25